MQKYELLYFSLATIMHLLDSFFYVAPLALQQDKSGPSHKRLGTTVIGYALVYT